jgi:RNA polymerase sigma-70 factor, ECF subfamily
MGAPRSRSRSDSWAKHEPREKADTPDRILVERFLSARDERDFRILYRRFSPALAQIVLRFVRGNHADAEEVLQTTWVRAVRGMPGFRWESSLKSWLTGIALNCSREHLRRVRRHDSTEPIELHDPVAPSRPPVDISRVELERAIARLPDGYREVLILHDIEGYTHLEIGGILGVEEGTSKSQLFRARRALRTRLASRA